MTYLNTSDSSANLQHLANGNIYPFTQQSWIKAQKSADKPFWSGVAETLNLSGVAKTVGLYETASWLLHLPKATEALGLNLSDRQFCEGFVGKGLWDAHKAGMLQTIMNLAGDNDLVKMCQNNMALTRINVLAGELLTHPHSTLLLVATTGLTLAWTMSAYKTARTEKEKARQELFNEVFSLYTNTAQELMKRYQSALKDPQKMEEYQTLRQNIQKNRTHIELNLFLGLKMSHSQRSQILAGLDTIVNMTAPKRAVT